MKKTMDNKPYVYGIRIFLGDGYKPMAELAFGEGGRPNGKKETIEWDRPDERDRFYISAYTFVWDERLPPEISFNNFVQGKCFDERKD